MAHTLRISELYAPELLTVRLEPSGRQYQLPRGLICAKSEYFNSAFKKYFSEGQNGVMTLDDVTPWVFEAFISWLYTDHIFWDPGNQPDPSFDAPTGQKDGENENDEQNVITWNWRNLIQMFIFADKYDTKPFRHDIMVIVQIKSLMKKPRQYDLPSYEESALAFTNLPDNSPLYRFLLDGYIYSRLPTPLATSHELLLLPPETLALLVNKLMQESCRVSCKACKEGKPCEDESHPDLRGKFKTYFSMPCHYHEHNEEDESHACAQVFEGINQEYGLGMQNKGSS